MARYISDLQMDAILLAIEQLGNVMQTCSDDNLNERLDDCIGELNSLYNKGVKSLRNAENRTVIKMANEIVNQRKDV